jgi:hypothetical protein
MQATANPDAGLQLLEEVFQGSYFCEPQQATIRVGPSYLDTTQVLA